jgi:hypothetical protein
MDTRQLPNGPSPNSAWLVARTTPAHNDDHSKCAEQQDGGRQGTIHLLHLFACVWLVARTTPAHIDVCRAAHRAANEIIETKKGRPQT